MSQHCSPCLLRYNFIIKLETFQEDLEYILHLIGANNLLNNIHILSTDNKTIQIQATSAHNISKKNEKETIENNLTLHIENEIYKYFNSVSNDLLFKVVEFLRDDLMLFDYNLPKFLTDKLTKHQKKKNTHTKI